MSGHDKGPWDYSYAPDHGYGDLVGATISDPRGYVLAVAVADVPELAAKANARLIAAAPELLEALRDLEICANTVEGCYTRNPGNFALALRELRDSAARARELFAKATGEQP